nr:MAG TPA: hypothetical protein [Bacteriophage sp.]
MLLQELITVTRKTRMLILKWIHTIRNGTKMVSWLTLQSIQVLVLVMVLL